MSRHNGNNSSLGTASHAEIYFNHTKKANSNRRSRYKCARYHNKTRICGYLGITCVGPSNELCKEYKEKGTKKSSSTKNDSQSVRGSHKKEINAKNFQQIQVSSIPDNAIVNDPINGVGMVMGYRGSGLYEIRFVQNKVTKIYTRGETSSILLNKSSPKK